MNLKTFATKKELIVNDMAKYNSYPLGKVPTERQRPDIYRLKDLGYEFDDAREVVDIFEKKVAAFAGCKYAVTTDCCTNGLFLCLKYIQGGNEIDESEPVVIPVRTYVSTAMQIIHAGYEVAFDDIEWTGIYRLGQTRIWDGAVRWTMGMYVGNNALQVVSFQFKKRIPIGRGGMILTDDFDAYTILKIMGHDGRDLSLPYDHPRHVKMIGYNMYMTPEDAARGIILMDGTSSINEDSGDHMMYPDVKKMMDGIRR